MSIANLAAPLSKPSQTHIRVSVHQTRFLDALPPSQESIESALMAVATATSQADLYEQIRQQAPVLGTASAIISCFATGKATLRQEFSPPVYEAAMFFQMLALYLIDMRRELAEKVAAN